MNWETMTAEQAEALAAGLAEGYTAPVTVGEPQPGEWPPLDHEPTMPRPTVWITWSDEDDAPDCDNSPARLG